MTILAVDIGNAQSVLGLVDDGEVVRDWRVSTDERRTADEWAVLVRGLLDEEFGNVTGVAICATVPSVLSTWREMLATVFASVPTVILGPGVKSGLPIAVDNPREVGTDRIANALAATVDHGAPAIVVDFGSTATTYDVVDPSGRYVGGAITPGLALSLEALSSRGAQLKMVELVRPRDAIGKNTVEALQSGIVFGVASQVEGMVQRLIDALGCPRDEITVIATGYLAPLVLDECGCFDQLSPSLTLRGLAMIHARNT